MASASVAAHSCAVTAFSGRQGVEVSRSHPQTPRGLSRSLDHAPTPTQSCASAQSSSSALQMQTRCASGQIHRGAKATSISALSALASSHSSTHGQRLALANLGSARPSCRVSHWSSRSRQGDGMVQGHWDDRKRVGRGVVIPSAASGGADTSAAASSERSDSTEDHATEPETEPGTGLAETSPISELDAEHDGSPSLTQEARNGGASHSAASSLGASQPGSQKNGSTGQAAGVPQPGSLPRLQVGVEEGKQLLTWRLIFGLLWGQRLRVALALVALVGGTVCNVSIPRTSGRFIQSLITPTISSGSLLRLLLPLALLYALEPLCTMLYVTNLCSAWEKVVAALRVEVFQRILAQEISYFDKHKVSDLTSIISTELSFIEKGVIDNVTRDRGLRSLCEVSSSLVMIFLLCPDLAPLLVLLVVGISVTAGTYKKAQVAVYKAGMMAQSRLVSLAGETLGAVRTVRSFGGESRQLGLFTAAVEKCERLGAKMSFSKSASEGLTRGSVYISLLGIYALCGARVRSGQLDPGTLLAFVGYIFILTFAIQGFLNTTTDLQNVFAAAARINALVPPSVPRTSCRDSETTAGQGTPSASPPPLLTPAAAVNGSGVPPSSAGDAATVTKTVLESQNVTVGDTVVSGAQGPCVGYPLDAAWHGDLSFEDVSFSYPQRPEVEVLKGISLHLPRGTVTALVGGSGAGKTTIVQLLSRFYEPLEGRIRLGSWDICAFDRRDWSQAVSLVSQEPVLFAMSIRDNIAYGRAQEDHISDERIEAAARAANAHDFITRLPEGYNTLVGERGSLLSGGQRQRLAIARAILKDAPILILDEATSALDSVSEKLVQEALNKLMKGRTTLVIAHRLSTVQEANQIVVLEGGEIVELGTHQELLKQNGAYATLVTSQNLTFAA